MKKFLYSIFLIFAMTLSAEAKGKKLKLTTDSRKPLQNSEDSSDAGTLLKSSGNPLQHNLSHHLTDLIRKNRSRITAMVKQELSSQKLVADVLNRIQSNVDADAQNPISVAPKDSTGSSISEKDKDAALAPGGEKILTPIAPAVPNNEPVLTPIAPAVPNNEPVLTPIPQEAHPEFRESSLLDMTEEELKKLVLDKKLQDKIQAEHQAEHYLL